MEFEVPLVLTTPLIRGQRVKDAQWLLAGHNRWRDFHDPIRTYKGPIDGQYGPLTATATKRAKYLLGYVDNAINGQFGQQIYNYLTDTKLPKDMLETRMARLKEMEKPPKAKALEMALGYQGVKESPFGSNRQMFGQWYGMNGVPWCAIFVSYCLTHNGRYFHYSYVPAIVEDARYGRNKMSLTNDPQPGDLVSYTFHGKPNAHTAFFHSWADVKHYAFYDVGGNTGPVNMSNGGEVLKQERNITQVTHFIRLW
jgi:hypothetical protein